MPKDDAALVAKLKAAGAIILGKTNVSELNGLFDANMPEGYSSLGGQVLLPSDTDKTPAGSSGGSAAATASGLAALTVGLETSTDTAQLIAPGGRRRRRRRSSRRSARSAAPACCRSRSRRTRRARSRARSTTRPPRSQAIAGADPRTRDAGARVPTTWPASPTALAGKKVAVIDSTTAPYPAVVSRARRRSARRPTSDRRHAEPEPAEHRRERVQA